MNSINLRKPIILKASFAAVLAVLLPPNAVEARVVNATSQEIRELRAELARTRAETQSQIEVLKAQLSKAQSDTDREVKTAAQKLQTQEQKIDQKLDKTLQEANAHRNLVYFRGGYASMAQSRNGELLINNDAIARTLGHSGNTNGWYIGAGFDFNVTPNTWGLWDAAQVDAELMFEYKDFGTSSNELVNFLSPLTIDNNISLFTLTASPKIKITSFGNFRPWIIPFGLALHVINPPSSGVTYLDPGVVFGVGAEYKLWRDWFAGVDFRYHVTGDNFGYKAVANGKTILNSTSLDGLTTGAYFGFGF